MGSASNHWDDEGQNYPGEDGEGKYGDYQVKQVCQ
tara:strand:- start:464 stop:568 length:105 start_codon:yes stop_codon:yes gene_type:complete